MILFEPKLPSVNLTKVEGADSSGKPAEYIIMRGIFANVKNRKIFPIALIFISNSVGPTPIY